MPFDDVAEQVSIAAKRTCAAAGNGFTTLADAAPEALSTAAATVGRLPPATVIAFVNAADAAADVLRTTSEAIRDGSGGLVNPTVLMSGLEGGDLIPVMVGVTFVIFLLLMRLVAVIHRKWVGATAAALTRSDDTDAKAASANRRIGEQSLMEESQRSAGSRSTFFSARDLLSLPSFRRDRAPQDTSGLNEGGLYSIEREKEDEENEADLMNTGSGNSPTSTSQQPVVRPLPPLRILGPSVTSLEYIASQPPPEVPSIFATARYRSIHRKLILDMHRLTLGRCNPLKHPDVDPRDTNKFHAAMDESGYSSPRKGRLIMSEMTASRGASNEGVNGEMGAANCSPSIDPTSEESREVSFESQLDVKQTFDTPKVIPIASVLNTTAVSPAGCGSLEVTLDVTDQLWERQLMEDMQDPNKALAHIVAVESNQRELMKDFLLDEDNAETSLAKSVPRNKDEDDEGKLVTERGLGAPTVIPKENSKLNPKSVTMNSDTSKAEEPTRTISEEYTFDSAKDAAEFQSVVLALRLVGKEIRNMYQSLELLHMASDAFAGDEFVLHVPSKTVERKKNQGERDDSDQSDHVHPNRAGVAIDDVYRCLGEMPSVRRNLERFYRYHYPVDMQHHWEDSEHGADVDAVPSLLAAAAEQENSEDDTGNEMSTEVYQKKRLLLGIVDFVRLFSPPPGVGATPRPNPSAAHKAREDCDDSGIDGHKSRIVTAVAIRKRVAKAAVRVRAYVNAMKIVRNGWAVPNYGGEGNLPLYRQRLAFDDDIENIRRDCSTKNEFYESTVGRDVRCNVHDSRHLAEKGSSRPSSYQGFALVGCHIFQLPDDTAPTAQIHPLQSKNDPIAALPSLRKIIENNPEQDFFVQAFFSGKKKVALVALFVRTLPRGVDAAFDSVVDEFVAGDRSVRDRKLEVFLQLGPGSELPGSVWVALKVINWILRFSRRGEGDIPVLSNKVRTPFPGMRLSSYAETKHFGGSLRTNKKLPKNYVASTARFDEEGLQNPIMKALFNMLESSALKHCVLDSSFVLEGQRMDELPERVLGTVRLVHVNALDCALPLPYSSTGEIAAEAEINEGNESTSKLHGSSWFLRGITQSTMNIFGIESPQRDAESNSEVQSLHRDEAMVNPQNADPYKRDLDALKEILDGVMVPVRKVNLKGVGLVATTGAPTGVGEWTGAVESNAVLNDPRTPRTANGLKIGEAELGNIPVLQTYSRKDLTRFYLACYGDLKSTAIRVVESAAWRGLTFPIDTRACRIELRSNQIVQFGSDIRGNPVFYFRNMCLGPWRKDVDASLLATLHRVETSMKILSASNPSVKCTVVILMGKPVLGDSTNLRQGGETDEEGDTATSAASNVEDDSSITNSNGDDEKKEDGNGNSTSEEKTKESPYILGSDPRIDASEKYTVHTNATLIQRIVHALSTHYPERLAKCLIVPSNGFEKTVGGLTIRTYVPSLRTRSRITILESASDLRDYISDENLLTFVGGKALLPPESFV